MPLYSCDDMCGRNSECHGGIVRLRAASRCSLPDFDPAKWDPAADREAARFAEAQAETLVSSAKSQGLTLDFDLERDGCPQGWSLSRYALSVAEYVGQRSSSPVRSQNAKLWRRVMRDEAEPTELIDAVALLEAWQDNAWSKFHEVAGG